MKRFLVLLALLAAASPAWANDYLAARKSEQQMAMMAPIVFDTHHSGSGTVCGPLDAVTDPAAAAFGLRKLKNSYAGKAINIIRASDSTTTDIGFSGCDLDTATASTFCSATTCQVTLWYDQSGNGANCTFAPGNRPVLNLSSNLQNGHPTITWSLSDPDYCTGTYASGVSASTIATVLNYNSSTVTYPTIYSDNPAGTDGTNLTWNKSLTQIQARRTVSSSNYDGTIALAADNAWHQVMSTYNNTLSRAFLDGTSGTDSTTSTTLVAQTAFQVGENSGCGSACYMGGYVAEVIAFAPDINSTDAATVQTNMKSYWATP